MPTFECGLRRGICKCKGRIIVHRPLLAPEGGVPIGVCFRCRKMRMLTEAEYSELLTNYFMGDQINAG